MNAALKVPSENNLLNVLGNLKATKKASAKIEVPKKIAIKKKGTYIKPPAGTPCQCCNIPMTYGMGMDGMCFDHDSVKEEFRGWICKKCNTSMGLHGDNLEGIRKLVMYLEERQ